MTKKYLFADRYAITLEHQKDTFHIEVLVNTVHSYFDENDWSTFEYDKNSSGESEKTVEGRIRWDGYGDLKFFEGEENRFLGVWDVCGFASLLANLYYHVHHMLKEVGVSPYPLENMKFEI